MPNPWEMTYATDPGKQPWEQAWPAAKKLSIEEEASQAAGIPLRGIQPPKVKMEQTPGATGLNLINEAVIRPARSIQKGYYEGAAGGAHLLSNMAKGAGKLTGTTPGGAFESAEKYYQDEAQKLEGQGASGLAKSLYEGLGRAPADLAKYTVATRALGGIAGMATADAITESDKGVVPALTAGAKGAALGSLGHVMAPARRATRMAGMGTAMGAETAIAGGSPTDIAAAALTGAGMAAPGANGTSFKNARLGEQRANIELENLRREHAQQAARPGDYFGTRETAPNEQPVDIPVPKTEQQPAPVAKSRKEILQEKFGDKTKAAQDEAYRQGYADVHPEDSTRLPWEYSWQARPDTALPATPFKSAAESAAVFEAPRSAKESADVFRRELNQKPRVPETGDPFERRRDTQERMAQQLGGKPWEQLTPDEQQQVNAWIDEGYHGEVIPPQVQAPAPKSVPPTKPMFQQDQRVLGKQEQAARLKEEADAYQQGYRDVHPDDMTRLPWEESWQARPDTAKPATPFKSAKESAEVFNDREIGQQIPAGLRQGQEPGNVPNQGRSAAQGEAGPVLQEQGEVPAGPSRQDIPPEGREGLQPVGKEVIQPDRVSAPAAGAVQAAPAQRTISDPKEMRIPIEDLNVDPQRFQYKMDAYLKGGVTDEYKGVTKYDRDKAGTIAVWRDPADGKTYVVNGHHRYEMASRLGEDSMAVRYVDAANPAEARLKGALINIGDGKGTAIDAAKVFRDSGLTPEELANSGISLKGKIAEDGMALSKLTGVLFDDVVRGGLTHRQGAIIGKGNLSESAQLAVAKFMASHPNMREGALEEVVRRAGKSGTKTVEQESLFGTNAYEENLFNEEAHLVADIKARLGQEKRLFGAVGSQSAASRLAGAGNKIEAERNAQIAGEAGEALGAFDALQDKSGPIADAIAQAAREVADGKPRKAAADRLYDVVRAEVSKALRREEGGLFAEPGGGVADGPAEVSGQPRVSQRRLDSQGGFLTIPGKQPAAPLDAADLAEQAWAAKREAAREKPDSTVREMVTKGKEKLVDNLAPILDRLANATDSTVLRDWSNAADRSRGSREIAERMVRDDGLYDAIMGADNYDRLGNVMVAKEVIREAQQQGRTTGVDLAEAKAIYNKYINAPANEAGTTYGQLTEKVGQAGDKLLDYSVNAGLIGQSMADTWRKLYGREHIPLGRIVAALDDSGVHLGSKAVSSLAKQSVYGKRTGSELAIEHPIETLLKRTQQAVAQGEKNKAARLLASYENEPGLKGLMRENPDADAKRSFSYLRDGKKVVVETTPEIAAAAKSLNEQQLNAAVKVLNIPARIARMGTTGANLAFGLLNPVGDWGATMMSSKEWLDTCFNPKVIYDAFKAAVLHDANWSRIESSGAGFTSLDLLRDTMPKTIEGMRQFRSGKDFAKNLIGYEKIAGEQNPYKKAGRIAGSVAAVPVKTAAGLARAVEDFNNRGEQFGRARLYLGTERANLRRGKSAAEAEAAATFAANNELPNYRRRGETVAGLGGMVLFLNARVQGVRTLMAAAQDRPVQTAAKLMFGVVAPTAILSIANNSTPEKREINKDIQEYDKQAYLYYISDGARKNPKTGRWEGVYKVKMSPDLGQLSTPIRRYIESQMGGGEKFSVGKDLATPLAGSVLPFEPSPSGVVTGLLPQAFKPPIESLANYDTFRKGPIVPQKLADFPLKQQAQPNTSATARWAAGALKNTPIGEQSPLKVEHFVKGVLGGYAPQLLYLTDRAAAAAGKIRPDQVGGKDTAVAIAERITSAPGGAQENNYYTLRRQAQEKWENLYIDTVTNDPMFRTLDKKEQQRAVASAANRARAALTKAEGGKAMRDAPASMRIQIMKQLIQEMPSNE